MGPQEMHLVNDADLRRLIRYWEHLPKRDAMDVAYAEGIVYALAELRLPKENAPTAGKQDRDIANNKSRSL